jgi:3-deoxy-D-manno-octulosonic acid (KDO) 8-phosphate synthase
LNDGNWQLVAEGFSSSILPAFEKSDIDMLYKTKNTGDTLSVKITNEALETHMTKYANLLAFPQNEGEKVFATQRGEFYRMENLVPPLVCNDRNGSLSIKSVNPITLSGSVLPIRKTWQKRKS